MTPHLKILKPLLQYLFTLWLFSPLIVVVFVISLITAVIFALTATEDDFYRPYDV